LGHEVSWQAWQAAASAGRRFDVYSRRSSLKIQAAEVKATLSLPRQLLIGSSTYKDRAGALNSSTSAKNRRSSRGDFLLALQFLSGLETNRLAHGNRDFLTGAWISPNATFARFDHEHAKPAQLDPVAPRQRVFHRMKQGIDGLLGLKLGNAGAIGKTIDDIEFDHGRSLRDAGNFKSELFS